MNKIFILLVSLFIAQQSVADTVMNKTAPKQCDMIADACLKAGFSEAGKEGKAIWYDCMKPILLGKSVANVSVGSKDVAICRKFKIADLQDLLKELSNVR
jgi:hypothetical protein